MRPRAKKMLFIAPFAILGMVLFIFLGGEIVMRLWNWLAPALFGWPRITFWQALGLLVLCRILFGGRGLRSGRSRLRRRVEERIEERIEERMEERYGAMTPEERERFRQRIRERCGFEPSAGAAENPE